MSKLRTRRKFLKTGAKAGLAMLAASGPMRAVAQNKGVTITFWHFIDPRSAGVRQGVLKAQIEQFERENPDIRVKTEILGPQQIAKQMIEGALVKKGPDVANVFSPWMTRPVNAGVIEPLNDYAKSVDKTDWIADWNKFAVYNGQKMGIPWEHRVWVLMARKDALAQKGLTPPKNWAELEKVAGKIGPQSPMGIALGLATKDDGNWMGEFFVPAVWSNGGEIFDDSGKPVFNNPQGAEVLQSLADMVNKHKGTSKAVLGWGYSEAHEAIKSGAATMLIIGTHRFREIRAGAPHLVMEPFPGLGAKRLQTQVDGQSYVMGKFSQNKTAAWRFIEFMTNSKSAGAVAKGGSMPPRKSSWSDPWFKSAEAADLVQMKDYAEKYGRWMQLPELWTPLQVKLAEATQKVILTGMRPRQALDEVAAWYSAATRK